MKKFLFIFLGLIISTLALAQNNPFRLVVSGHSTYSESLVKDNNIQELRNVCDSLIRKGYIPTVLNKECDVVWIYLYDPTSATDFIDDDEEEVDYGEPIYDLFPIKLNKQLKRIYQQGNASFMKKLGITYSVDKETDEVISIIDYEKFIGAAF